MQNISQQLINNTHSFKNIDAVISVLFLRIFCKIMKILSVVIKKFKQKTEINQYSTYVWHFIWRLAIMRVIYTPTNYL